MFVLILLIIDLPVWITMSNLFINPSKVKVYLDAMITMKRMLFSRMNSLDHFVEGVVPKFVYKECLHTKIYWDIWNVNNSLCQCFSPKTMIGFTFCDHCQKYIIFLQAFIQEMYLKNFFVFNSVISSLLNPFLMLEAEERSVQMTSVKKK